MKWLVKRIGCALFGHGEPVRMAIIGGFRCSRCDTAFESLSSFGDESAGYVNLDRPVYERDTEGNFMRHRRENIRLFRQGRD